MITDTNMEAADAEKPNGTTLIVGQQLGQGSLPLSIKDAEGVVWGARYGLTKAGATEDFIGWLVGPDDEGGYVYWATGLRLNTPCWFPDVMRKARAEFTAHELDVIYGPDGPGQAP